METETKIETKGHETDTKGIELVLTRNQYYWENYRQIALICFGSFLLMFGMVGFIIYLANTPPSPKYFATTPDGAPIEIVPLNRPYKTPEFVLDWAKKAVTQIYSLDFLTYRKTLQNNAIFFTWMGFANFLRAYKASNNLEAVKEKKQVVSVEITGPGQVVFAGQRSSDEPYTWDLNIPATFTYQNSKEDVVKQSGVFLITVSRTSTLVHDNGIAISQLVFRAT